MSSFRSEAETCCRLFLIIGAYVLLMGVSCSRQEGEEQQLTSTTNQNVEINNKHDVMKFNNHKVKNYISNENRYQPHSQYQIYLNVPKERKTRVSRAPSLEESALKQKIVQVYDAALDELDEPSSNLIHLGRIIRALNPKYIATQRVMRVAYADPNDPDVSVAAPESEIADPVVGSSIFNGHDDGGLVKSSASAQVGPGTVHSPVLSLSSDSSRPLVEQLSELREKFDQLFEVDKKFAMKLTQMDEKQLEPKLIAFKRLVQCVAFSPLCYSAAQKKANKQEQLLEPASYQDNHLKVSVPLAPIKVDFKAPRVVADGPPGGPSRGRVPKSTGPAEPHQEKAATAEVASNDPGEEYFKVYQSTAPRSRHQQQQPRAVDSLDQNYGYGTGYGVGYHPDQLHESQNYLAAEQMYEAQPERMRLASAPPRQAPQAYYGRPFEQPGQQGQFETSQYNADLSQRLQQKFGPLEGYREQPQQQQVARPMRNARFKSKLRRSFE